LSEQAYFRGLGKRKTAVAQVKLMTGNGAIIVNGKPYEDIYTIPRMQGIIVSPLKVTNMQDKLNAVVKVEGGGFSSQADAIRHGISRALVVMDADLKPPLKAKGMMTRDARIKERKKYGLKRARKARQYRKR
jgi:small subunit ribosomal protein S9